MAFNYYTTRLCTSGIDYLEKTRFQDGEFIQHVDDDWSSCNSEWLKVINKNDISVELREEKITIKKSLRNKLDC